MVVSGSLTEGMQVKLDPDSSVEAVKVGTFVTAAGRADALLRRGDGRVAGLDRRHAERQPARACRTRTWPG